MKGKMRKAHSMWCRLHQKSMPKRKPLRLHAPLIETQLCNRSLEELQKTNTAQEAAAASVSRSLHICAGLNIEVQDARKLRVQNLDVSSQLKDLQRGQQLSHGIIVQSGRILFNSLDRLDVLVLKLLHAFGSFSVTTLRLLNAILKTNLEIYALLRQVLDRILKQLFTSIEDCIHFTNALSRKQLLVYDCFKYWDVFESLFRYNFKTLPGELLICDGQFFIPNSRRKGLIIERQR
ncbi:hypothetical protein BDZ45DRAFT_733780 [Acephala macrosclerotiorum]|nr:hypothetical protein BDZ45DRAFT_733780 [Acephala macrosclerotiorum]